MIDNNCDFLLALGALLAINLTPNDFLEVEAKNISLVLPKKIIENKMLLEMIIILLPQMLMDQVAKYTREGIKDLEATNKKAIESLNQLATSINFTIPPKTTIQ